MPIKDDQGKTRGWCFEDDTVVDEIANAGEAFRTSNAGEADVELQHSVQECIGRVVLERTTDQPRPRIKYGPKLAAFFGIILSYGGPRILGFVANVLGGPATSTVK